MSRASELADRIHPRTDWYEFDAQTWCNEAAAELRRLDRVNAELARNLNEASNYIDVLGGTSKSYRAALTSATKETKE